MASLHKTVELLDPYITGRMEATGTPGMALALFDRKQCVRVSTHGFADLTTRTSVERDTLFEIGSITKTFTAVAVVLAAEAGLVDLHAPVTDYLPWFLVRSQYEPITIHHLLTHSAGIVGVIDRSPDVRGAVWALRETETAWPAGTHFHYSDAGYQTLGLVLVEVMGRSFPDIIQTAIFDPLGMTASEPALKHAMRTRMAMGYRSPYDDRPSHSSHRLVPAAWIESDAADCCVASTAEDMARFGRMLLNRGQGPDGRFLSTSSYELLTHNPIATDSGFSYGYGLQVFRSEKFAHIGHGGGMPGYSASILMDPDNGLGVVVLSTHPSVRAQELASTVVSLWRAAYLGRSLDAVDLSLPDPTHVQNAAEFAGTYWDGRKSLTLRAEDQHLVLQCEGDRIPLERRGDDLFYVNHPHFDRFLLRFGRAETGDGTPSDVIEACHGADWYVTALYNGPREFDYPSNWNAYPGHYRAHIPWQTNFRVVLRKGALWLVWPAGDEEPLTSLSNGAFRVGGESSPEGLRFDQLAKGQALRANYSGSDYYRFFTP